MKTKLLIFGITGDLSTRKLLPAIEQIINTGKFDDLSVIGVSRRQVDTSKLFINCIDKNFLGNKLSTFTMNLGKLEDYKKLWGYIDLREDEQLLVHMSVPPLITTKIVDLMGEAGINSQNVKVLFEKPFGVDLKSAQKLMEQTEQSFSEDQVYRIDHYLAKEMAQNIIAFRGRNALFNDVWNNKYIDWIEIVATQDIGIEGRVDFYEQTGALRDLIQGHLMQLLALTLTDIPPHLHWNMLPSLRLEALNYLQPVDPVSVIRGQYKTYKKEVSNPTSNVETFVSLELKSNHSSWQGVPIRLITGKALDKTVTEIRIHLKSNNGDEGNCLTFSIHPNEGIDMELFVKKPGYSRKFEAQHLRFNYPENSKLPDAYEQVLADAILSRKSLFAGGEEVLCSWRVLKPIQDYWENSKKPLKIYRNGSSVDDILA